MEKSNFILNSDNVYNFIQSLNKPDRFKLIKHLKVSGPALLFDIPKEDLVKSIKELWDWVKVEENENEDSEIEAEDEKEDGGDAESKNNETDEVDEDIVIPEFEPLEVGILAQLIAKKHGSNFSDEPEAQARKIILEKLSKLLEKAGEVKSVEKPRVLATKKSEGAFFDIDNFFSALHEILPENSECVNKLKGKKIEDDFMRAKLHCHEMCLLAYHYLSNLQKLIEDQCAIETEILCVENVCPNAFVSVFSEHSFIMFAAKGENKVFTVFGPGRKLVYESCHKCFDNLELETECEIVCLFLENIDQELMNSLPVVLAVKCYMNMVRCLNIDSDAVIDFYGNVNANAFVSQVNQHNGVFCAIESFQCDSENVRQQMMEAYQTHHNLPEIIGGENFAIIFAPGDGLVHLIRVNANLSNQIAGPMYCEVVFLKCMSSSMLLALKNLLLCDYFGGDVFGQYKGCLSPNEFERKNYLNLGRNRLKKVLHDIDENAKKDISSEQFNKTKENLAFYFKNNI